MTTHSSILGWEIPWTEEPGRLHSMGSQRARHDLATEHVILVHFLKVMCNQTLVYISKRGRIHSRSWNCKSIPGQVASTPWRVQVWVLGSNWDAFIGRLGSQTGWTWVLASWHPQVFAYLIYSLVRISISLLPRDCELKGGLGLVSSCLGEGTHYPAQISLNRQRKLWGKGGGEACSERDKSGTHSSPRSLSFRQLGIFLEFTV